MKINLFIIFQSCFLSVLGRQGVGPNEQEWGYVTVRPKAHIFWWLHQTIADVEHYSERPLVIWLQGGPGASSTGFGNFQEIGPLDVYLNARNTSWINDVNVLFVDNPVGTGFSYVEDKNALTKNNKEIAQDFLVFLKEFYKTIPELKDTSLYIVAESYGGKMAAEIALTLHEAVENGEIEVNIEGIGLGDSWISPVDSVMTWAPYLRELGYLDKKGFENVERAALSVQSAVQSGAFDRATYLWLQTENIIFHETQGVDFYNILTKISTFYSQKSALENLRTLRSPTSEDDLVKQLMNNYVKKALNLTKNHVLQSPEVFNALTNDFMRPATSIVETLLNTTSIKVTVFNGQLDLIVDTPGTIKWVNALKFNEAAEFKRKSRDPIVVDNIIEGFYKKAGNLAMYWVNRAGHMVPADNPAAMQFILSDLIQDLN